LRKQQEGVPKGDKYKISYAESVKTTLIEDARNGPKKKTVSLFRETVF